MLVFLSHEMMNDDYLIVIYQNIVNHHIHINYDYEYYDYLQKIIIPNEQMTVTFYKFKNHNYQA